MISVDRRLDDVSWFHTVLFRVLGLICSAAVLATLGASNQAWADPGMINLAIGGTATSTRTDFGATVQAGIDGNRDGNFGHGSVFYENADPTPGERPEAQQRGGGVADTDGRPANRLLRGEVGRRARLERCRDEGMAVALGHDGSVELPRPDRPRVDARSFDADIGPNQFAAQMCRQLRCRAAHGVMGKSK